MKLPAWFRRTKRRDRVLCCQDIERLSSDYMDEDLSPTIAREFKSHMDSCPDCNSFYATFRATILTLRNLPKHSAPADLKKRIQARLASESAGSSEGASAS